MIPVFVSAHHFPEYPKAFFGESAIFTAVHANPPAFISPPYPNTFSGSCSRHDGQR
jgi:hypothetical protein